MLLDGRDHFIDGRLLFLDGLFDLLRVLQRLCQVRPELVCPLGHGALGLRQSRRQESLLRIHVIRGHRVDLAHSLKIKEE